MKYKRESDVCSIEPDSHQGMRRQAVTAAKTGTYVRQIADSFGIKPSMLGLSQRMKLSSFPVRIASPENYIAAENQFVPVRGKSFALCVTEQDLSFVARKKLKEIAILLMASLRLCSQRILYADYILEVIGKRYR